MKITMSKAGFNAKKTADNRSQLKDEMDRKQLSAKRCKALGVTGPDDPQLLAVVELQQLRLDVDKLRRQVAELRELLTTKQLAKPHTYSVPSSAFVMRPPAIYPAAVRRSR